MNRDLQTLRSVLRVPTAPFREQAVVEHVRRFAELPSLGFALDEAGNVLLRYRRGRPGRAWVFAAHMDHPGFVATARRGRTLWARFLGSVEGEYFPGARARFFAPAGPLSADVESADRMRSTNGLSVRLRLDRPASVPPGTVGMWDVPAVRVQGGRVSARACDDLAGVAAVLCALRHLADDGAEADVTALLTRAEEVGFVGAVAACRAGSIPPRAAVVGVEASRAQPAAPLGAGAVIRVGDAARTFDPSLTAHVAAVAGELSAEGAGTFGRCLMPGGTCESTVYQAFGRRSAAVCLPLANYHNRGRGTRIAPEQIHLDDFHSLVALLVRLGRSRYDAQAGRARLVARVEGRFDALARDLHA